MDSISSGSLSKLCISPTIPDDSKLNDSILMAEPEHISKKKYHKQKPFFSSLEHDLSHLSEEIFQLREKNSKLEQILADKSETLDKYSHANSKLKRANHEISKLIDSQSRDFKSKFSKLREKHESAQQILATVVKQSESNIESIQEKINEERKNHKSEIIRISKTIQVMKN
jgi:septal ring factor EnvC (AmiA/AmiB activator)